MRWERREASCFAFVAREEAEVFRDAVRGERTVTRGALTVSAPTGAVLTAHVVGPNRRGAREDYPYLVAVGCRRAR